jgi:hypothetical protein
MGASGHSPVSEKLSPFRKDASLDRLADLFNVAQFVSFAPSPKGPVQQFSRLADASPNVRFGSTADAVRELFRKSAEGTVNVRSFDEDRPQSREFIYGLETADDVLSALSRLSAEGLFTIANETIDVSDGGVSGVAMGEIVEFGPDTTPRGVEKTGFATLPRDWAQTVFSIVYGATPDFDFATRNRIEFSLHPRARGYRQTPVLYWELGESGAFPAKLADARWPNDFSRMIGDKAYGLLVAHAAGMPVPRTTVIGRRVAPFTFGEPTGSNETWLRTCPTEQQPGRFSTFHGWKDPFLLMEQEDPGHDAIASVLSQASVPAVWSGAAIETSDGELVIEGVRGTGDRLMLGAAAPAELPPEVKGAVTALHGLLRHRVGDVRFEWVFDGRKTWLVQLHRGATASSATVIVPGEASEWVIFHAADGLEALRDIIRNLPVGAGIVIDGAVGLTSHVADLARKARIPTRIGTG